MRVKVGGAERPAFAPIRQAQGYGEAGESGQERRKALEVRVKVRVKVGGAERPAFAPIRQAQGYGEAGGGE